MSKLVSNSVIYTVVSVAQKAIGFFLLPVYTYFLAPEDYGIVAVVSSIAILIGIVSSLSLSGAANRFYFKYHDDDVRVKKLWGTLLIVTAISAFLFAFFITIFNKYIIQPFLGGIPFYPYMGLALASVTLNSVYSFFQTCVQAKQDGVRYGLNNFSFFIVNLLLTLLFVVLFNWGAFGILLAQLITNVFFFVYTLIVFIPTLAMRIDSRELKVSLRYSLPLLPHSLFGWSFSTIDRVLINKIKSISDAGLYNVASQFALLLSVLTDSVNKAYAPWFFEKLNQGDEGRVAISKVSESLVLLYALLAIGLSWFTPEILMLMTQALYHNAWVVVPSLASGYVFGGIYYLVCNSLFISRTWIVPLVTLSSAIVSVIMNLLLIPSFGIVGASVASLLAQFVTSFIAIVVSMKVETVKYKWFRMYAYAVIGYIMSLGVFVIPEVSAQNIMTKIGVYAVLCAVVLVRFKSFLSSFYWKVFNTINRKPSC